MAAAHKYTNYGMLTQINAHYYIMADKTSQTLQLSTLSRAALRYCIHVFFVHSSHGLEARQSILLVYSCHL